MDFLIIILCIAVPFVCIFLCITCYSVYDCFTPNAPLSRARRIDEESVLPVPSSSTATSDRNRNRESFSSQDSTPEASSSNPSNQDSTVGSSYSLSIDERTLQVQNELKGLDRRRSRIEKMNPQEDPLKSYALSTDEKVRINRRLKEQILSKLFPKSLLPPKPFRPPKSPSRFLKKLNKRSPKKPKKTSVKNHSKGFVSSGKNPSKGAVSSGKNPSKGVVSASDGTRKEEEEIKDYDAATETCVSIPIDEIYKMIGRIDSMQIQGLTGKIYAILHGGTYRIFKNYDKQGEEPKRSVYDWAQECDNLETFKELKINAAYEGTLVCQVIVDVMFLMSQNDENELGRRFQAFERILTYVDAGEDTVVVSKILDLIQQTETQLRRKRESEKAAMEEAARASKGKNVLTEEQKMDTQKLGDPRKEWFLDQIMFLLLELIFKMELFWVYKRLPYIGSLLIEELPKLEYELTTFRSLLFDMRTLIVQHALFGALSADWKENDYYKEMKSKIDGLWHELLQ